MIGRFAGAVALVLLALGPARADGPQSAAQATAALKDLALASAYTASQGGRADWSKPPASAQLGHIFDTQALTALPPPRATDVPWMTEWLTAATGAYKLMTTFGAAAGADTAPVVDRNYKDYQDDIAPALAFVIRLQSQLAVAVPLMFLALPVEELTPARHESWQDLRRAVIGSAIEAVKIATEKVRPVNARPIAAALRDTVRIWGPLSTSGERQTLTGLLTAARTTINDAEVGENLAAVSSALESVKD